MAGMVMSHSSVPVLPHLFALNVACRRWTPGPPVPAFQGGRRSIYPGLYSLASLSQVNFPLNISLMLT